MVTLRRSLMVLMKQRPPVQSNADFRRFDDTERNLPEETTGPLRPLAHPSLSANMRGKTRSQRSGSRVIWASELPLASLLPPSASALSIVRISESQRIFRKLASLLVQNPTQ